MRERRDTVHDAVVEGERVVGLRDIDLVCDGERSGIIVESEPRRTSVSRCMLTTFGKRPSMVDRSLKCVAKKQMA